MVVINDESSVIELINPIINEVSEETQEVMGSVTPDSPHGMTVTRPKIVTVKAFDRNGNEITVKGEDFIAATLCHEIDHLDGVLFTDKAHKAK